VSADTSASPTVTATTLSPVPERAAAAILGTMITLILLLTAILVRTTWVDPVSATDAPPVETAGFAQR
jgi:hypothetical protein